MASMACTAAVVCINAAACAAVTPAGSVPLADATGSVVSNGTPESPKRVAKVAAAAAAPALVRGALLASNSAATKVVSGVSIWVSPSATGGDFISPTNGRPVLMSVPPVAHTKCERASGFCARVNEKLPEVSVVDFGSLAAHTRSSLMSSVTVAPLTYPSTARPLDTAVLLGVSTPPQPTKATDVSTHRTAILMWERRGDLIMGILESRSFSHCLWGRPLGTCGPPNPAKDDVDGRSLIGHRRYRLSPKWGGSTNIDLNHPSPRRNEARTQFASQVLPMSYVSLNFQQLG